MIWQSNWRFIQGITKSFERHIFFWRNVELLSHRHEKVSSLPRHLIHLKRNYSYWWLGNISTLEAPPPILMKRNSTPSSLDDNLLNALDPGNCGVWQYELHQMIAENNAIRLELQNLEKLSKQRKRSRLAGNTFQGCANCHTRQTPEWRRGPSGQRDLCNSCGLRWAKSSRARQQTWILPYLDVQMQRLP